MAYTTWQMPYVPHAPASHNLDTIFKAFWQKIYRLFIHALQAVREPASPLRSTHSQQATFKVEKAHQRRRRSQQHAAKSAVTRPTPASMRDPWTAEIQRGQLRRTQNSQLLSAARRLGINAHWNCGLPLA
ncbi:Hypothetical predicted protein, partial [Pelobates cultripes]